MDLESFASRLLPQIAPSICRAWSVLNSQQPEAIQEAKNSLHSVDTHHLQTGDLKGLLFGDPVRFVEDLISQLQLMADLAHLKHRTAQRTDTSETLSAFYHSFLAWQQRHGFSDWARGPFISRVQQTLEPIIPGISSIPFDPRHGYTLRILDTVKKAAQR
jgi:hypothetical protein